MQFEQNYFSCKIRSTNRVSTQLSHLIVRPCFEKIRIINSFSTPEPNVDGMIKYLPGVHLYLTKKSCTLHFFNFLTRLKYDVTERNSENYQCQRVPVRNAGAVHVRQVVRSSIQNSCLLRFLELSFKLKLQQTKTYHCIPSTKDFSKLLGYTYYI